MDCAREVMREHCYWPIVSDLINVLAHSSIVKIFTRDTPLLQFWFELLAYFQGIVMTCFLGRLHVFCVIFWGEKLLFCG